MPLPFTHKDWKKKSNRMCGWRSSALKDLDSAILLHEYNACDHATLKTTFYSWWNHNPNERNNSRRNGRQVIALLKVYVDTNPAAAAPAHTHAPAHQHAGPSRGLPPQDRGPAAHQAFNLAELQSALPAEVAATVTEQAAPHNIVTEHSRFDGQDWSFLVQGLQTTCGPTCVATAASIIKQEWVHESAARGHVNHFSDLDDRANPKDPAMAMGLGPSDKAMQQFIRATGAGTYMNTLSDALNQLISSSGYTSFISSLNAEGDLHALIQNGPVILRIAWWNGTSGDYDGGGHFVLAVASSHSGITILDPWYGLQDRPWGELPLYCATPSVNSKTGRRGEKYWAKVDSDCVAVLPV